MQEPHAHELPVFWGHGDLDNVVAHSWGEESIADLHKMGFRDVEFFSYPCAFPFALSDGLRLLTCVFLTQP